MAGWIDRVDFPDAWIDLRSLRERLAHHSLVESHRRELRREIGRRHVLRGRDWTIIGLGVPARDDALLSLDDGSVALVHLTWRGAPEAPSWPTTTFVASPQELRAELEDRGFEWVEGAGGPSGDRDPFRCVVDGDAMWALLRDLDDPDHLEFPADHDRAAASDVVEQLSGALEGAFSCRCEVDRAIEDASLHARITIPAGATETGDRLVVHVSNFAPLATVSVTNPGVWSQAEFEERLARPDAARIYAALDLAGRQAVPEASLWTVYDGPSALRADSRFAPTWWTRFFDHL